jgi:Zn-dependent peptidase ImmA (M78 family)
MLWVPVLTRLDRLVAPPDTRRVPSLHSNRGAKRAREARAALGFTREGPLPDVLAAVEERGGAHALVLELPDGVAGAYIARPKCPLLFVNGRQPSARQRFTLAHEFGHHRMGHSTVIDEQAVISGYTHDPNEVSANAFAAEFLMPRDAVTQWGAEHVRGGVTLEDVVILASEYGVSAQAARYALETAKVLSGGRRCELLDEEIESGLHVEVAERLDLSPMQDELADTQGRLPRIPRTLRGSALGELLAGTIGPARLAERVGRDPADVQAMLAELGIDQLIASPEARR